MVVVDWTGSRLTAREDKYIHINHAMHYSLAFKLCVAPLPGPAAWPDRFVGVVVFVVRLIIHAPSYMCVDTYMLNIIWVINLVPLGPILQQFTLSDN